MDVIVMPALLLKAANSDSALCRNTSACQHAADKYGIVLKSTHDSYNKGDVPESKCALSF